MKIFNQFQLIKVEGDLQGLSIILIVLFVYYKCEVTWDNFNVKVQLYSKFIKLYKNIRHIKDVLQDIIIQKMVKKVNIYVHSDVQDDLI